MWDKRGFQFQRLLIGRGRKPAWKALVRGLPGFIMDIWSEKEVKMSSRKRN